MRGYCKVWLSDAVPLRTVNGNIKPARPELPRQTLVCRTPGKAEVRSHGFIEERRPYLECAALFRIVRLLHLRRRFVRLERALQVFYAFCGLAPHHESAAAHAKVTQFVKGRRTPNKGGALLCECQGARQN